MKKTISLCMIVKNEEKVLDKCLSSVKNKVDEIIIVDTGSTDSTLDIARKYTSKIYSFEWINDFSAARNQSLDYATSEYLFVLDADEYLQPDTDLYAILDSEKDFYMLRVKNLLSHGWAHTHTSIRLFVNKPALRYKNRLHEHLNTEGEGKQYTSGLSDVTIMHTGYTDETVLEKDKLARNLPIMLQEVEENPNGYNLFNTGNAYYSLQNYEKAIEFYQKSYPMSKERSYTPELLTKLATCLSYMGRHEDGLNILIDAVKLFPNTVDLQFAQGRIYLEAGYLKDSELAFLKCLEMGDEGITVTEGSGGYGAHYYLSLLYSKKGELSKSYDQIIQVIKQKKLFPAGLNHYFDIIQKANIPFEEAFGNVELIYNVSNVEELRSLMEAMYSMRHPLLNKYLTTYKLNVEPNIAAAALQYDRQYDEAKQYWLKSDISEENSLDVMLLALILKDKELYELSLPNLNLSFRELELFKGIVTGNQPKKITLTSKVESMVLKVVSHLIVLQEFELFESISLLLLSSGNNSIKYKLGETLISFGFNEVAIDILTQCFEEQPNNPEVVRLLGDVCFKAGYLQDAQLLYSKLLELKPEYSSYERCYDIYAATEDSEGMQTLKDEIERKFHLAMWSRGYSIV